MSVDVLKEYVVTVNGKPIEVRSAWYKPHAASPALIALTIFERDHPDELVSSLTVATKNDPVKEMKQQTGARMPAPS